MPPDRATAVVFGSRFQGTIPVELLVAHLCLCGIVLAAGVFSAVMLFDEIRIAKKIEKAPVIPMRSVISVGSDAKLSFGTSKVVTIAADDHSLLEVIGAISTSDDQKTEALLKSGKAFSVEPDTKVRVLTLAGGKLKCRSWKAATL